MPDYTQCVPSPFLNEDDHTTCASAHTVSHHVCSEQWPHFKVFYKHYLLRITLDTGAKTSMIKSSVAHSIGAPIEQSSQQALQADGMTSSAVASKTHLILCRVGKQLAFDALIVDDLDVDILAGTPILITNDITVHPAKCQVCIQESEIIHYEPTDDTTTGSHAVRRAQSFTLRAPSSATVVWPGEYLELDIRPGLGHDHILALQSHTDTPISKHTKPTHIWPEPQILEAVRSKICLVNAAMSTSARSYPP